MWWRTSTSGLARRMRLSTIYSNEDRRDSDRKGLTVGSDSSGGRTRTAASSRATRT